jgi:ribosomal protein S24E
MSMIEVTSDVKNDLLARREITCTFRGLAGKLKKPEAADMISKQFNITGKVIVPIILKNETGRPMVSGTFYIYDDEKLARQHLKPAIFSRQEKAKGGGEKEGETKEALAEKPAEKKEGKAKEAPAEKPEDKKEAKEPKESKEPKKEAKEPEKKVKESKEPKKEESK